MLIGRPRAFWMPFTSVAQLPPSCAASHPYYLACAYPQASAAPTGRGSGLGVLVASSQWLLLSFRNALAASP